MDEQGSANQNDAQCAMKHRCEMLSKWWTSMCHPLEDVGHARRHILIVDDDETVANTTLSLLRSQLACKVAAAYSGDEALEYLKSNVVDVVISDLMMPGCHGLQLIEAIRRQYPYTDVIVVTAFSADFPYVDVVRAGARDFVAKPYSRVELEAKLLRVFNERDLRDAQVLAENKYRSIFELNSDGMILLDTQTHSITDANRAFCSISGLSRENLVLTSVFDLFDTDGAERLQIGLMAFQNLGQGTVGDVLLAISAGRQTFVDITVTYVQVAPEPVICLTFKDITEKRSLQERLADAAQKDGLTGLFNQRAFHTRLEGAIMRSRNLSTDLTLMLLDLDNFKKCNDTYGHQVGDRLLRTVGDLILSNIRKNRDEGFRCGGDEFGIIISDADDSVAFRIGEQVRKEFEKADSCGTTISIGIAQFKKDMDPQTLAKAADEALYRAKALGKNSLCVA